MRLADYQDAFAQALLADDASAAAPALSGLVAQPGFSVYRNTVLKGCIDALQANFPAVAQLVGDEWFRAAAAVFVRSGLPVSPTLLDYGERFADFLADFEPAAALTYLPDVARVERWWSEAHVAADDEVLAPESLVCLTPADMPRLGLRPHAAARWGWFDTQPIYTLWRRNRDADADPTMPIDWRGEGVLLTRPSGAISDQPLTRAGAAFLDACAAGLSIEQAVTAALDVEPAPDLAALINQCLQAGAFNSLQVVQHDRETIP